jgi:UPF0755 protein
MKFRSIIFFFLILTACVFASAFYLFNYYTEKVTFNSQLKIVEIKKGDSVKTISKKLQENNVIINDRLFVLYVIYNKYDSKLKAGEYEFSKNVTIKNVAHKLISGEVKLRRVTIPEGLTAKQIARIFEKNNLFSASRFLSVLEDQNLKKELLGSGINSFEGFLFPETYNYSKDIKPEEFVRIMVEMFKKVFGELKLQHNGENKLSDYEIIKLASIIEKESGSKSELAQISSVFHNRLRIGMKLDSDPTIIYGLGDSFDGNIREKDLEHFTEYNTYMIPGLPPTPISNPGRASLHAAMNPDDTAFLYFVSMGNGSHYFSKNYNEHRRAVYNYQIKRKN